MRRPPRAAHPVRSTPRRCCPCTWTRVAYGQTLAAQVFADPEALAYLRAVRTAVESSDRVLRLRLLVGPTAAELHALRWELLCDPDSGAPLATSERVLFSRFMLSQDWRPVRLRPKAALRALVAVAAPTDLAEYGLAPMDLAGEVQRARDALAGIAVQVAGQEQPLTIESLDQALRQGVDILYLVAHGALSRAQGPVLFLQDDQGLVRRVAGDDLAQRIAELREPPRLLVLASCESAASGDAPLTLGQSPLKPTARPSPPAPRPPWPRAWPPPGCRPSLAMQGKISMATVAAAMPCFFRELLKDGQLDRALAQARGLVRERPDAWMPALFLRLRGGRLWYQPGFGNGDGKDAAGAAGGEAVKWAALVNDVQQKRFTPILGWGLAEGIYGGIQDLAQRLATGSRFPLAPHQCADLPQVSQYLGVAQHSSQLPPGRGQGADAPGAPGPPPGPAGPGGSGRQARPPGQEGRRPASPGPWRPLSAHRRPAGAGLRHRHPGQPAHRGPDGGRQAARGAHAVLAARPGAPAALRGRADGGRPAGLPHPRPFQGPGLPGR